MADLRKFWMVAGNGPTHVRHSEMYLAEREADRLARANPGAPFFVMEAVAVHRKVDVERIDLRSDHNADQEQPF